VNPVDRIQPSQLAMLLLASRESLPRARARDQQADLAGSQLKQRVLQRIIDTDPDSKDFAAILEEIIEEIGEPTGPTRAIARIIIEEWTSAMENPELIRWLIDQAAQTTQDDRR
jgi:hypothetical protein